MIKLFSLAGTILFSELIILTALSGVPIELINIFLFMNKALLILLELILLAMSVYFFKRK